MVTVTVTVAVTVTVIVISAVCGDSDYAFIGDLVIFLRLSIQSFLYTIIITDYPCLLGLTVTFHRISTLRIRPL